MQKLTTTILASLLLFSCGGKEFASEEERCEYLVEKQAKHYDNKGGFTLDAFIFIENDLVGDDEEGEEIRKDRCLMRYTQDGSVKVISLKIIEDLFQDPPEVLAKFNTMGLEEEETKNDYKEVLRKYFDEDYQNGY